MANLAQLVNVIAPIFTSPQGLYRQAIYWPLHLFATHAQSISLDVMVESDTFTAQTDPQDNRFLAPLMPLPYLDVSATCDESGQAVTLFVVNRHADDDIEAAIQFTDFAPSSPGQAYEVNGPDLKAVNDFDDETVRVTKRTVTNIAAMFNYRFPAHSVTVMALRA